jgi:putative spermidine/putrescine transport system ATP-binding protein
VRGRAFNALSELTMTIKRGEFIAPFDRPAVQVDGAQLHWAGLLPLSGGSIMLDETRIDTLPPERRGFGWCSRITRCSRT